MYTLSTGQKQTLVDILIEEHGCQLDFDAFAEAVVTMCDDIPGFETVSGNQSNRIINSLWRKYHGHKSV